MLCERLVRVLLVGGSVIAVPIALFADQRFASPAFEVASVRLSPADSRQSQQILDTRVTLAGQPLQSVMRLAFRATDYQLSAPAWLKDVRIDIRATLPRGATTP